MRRTKQVRIPLLLIVAFLLAACGGGEQQTGQKSGVDEGMAAEAVKPGAYKAPKVAEPCGNDCPYEGDTVTVTVNTAGKEGPISGPLYEVRDEFEAATGATLEIVELPFAEHFPKLMSDLTSQTGQYDASIAGAWWLGDLVGGDFILPYDEYYDDPKFPQWDDQEVLPGPRDLLSYGGDRYMVANDHDGQVMYYRRDLLEDPKHQRAFQEEYGYELRPPQTWDEFGDVAEYFNGKDLNGDGQDDSGLTMHLKVGGQGMFHFMSFSAPYVIGPENPNLYWFDPENMEPLIDSPGHVRALEKLVELTQYGPEAMTAWSWVRAGTTSCAARRHLPLPGATSALWRSRKEARSRARSAPPPSPARRSTTTSRPASGCRQATPTSWATPPAAPGPASSPSTPTHPRRPTTCWP